MIASGDHDPSESQTLGARKIRVEGDTAGVV